MISIDFTIVLTILNFGILYFLMKNIFWLPVMDIIRQREQMIADNIKKSESLREEAENKTMDCRNSIRSAKREASLLIDKEKQRAWTERQKKIEEIQAKNFHEMEKERLSLEEQASKSLKHLSEDTAPMAANIAGKLMAQNREGEL